MNTDAKKTLWEQYGKGVLIGLIVLGIVYGGYQYYEYRGTEQILSAAMSYEKALAALRLKDRAKVKELSKELIESYPDTAYAPLVSLTLARLALDEKDIEGTKAHLRFAMSKEKIEPISHIARVRLARILADQKNYEEALKLLETTKIPKAYTALYEETKGDIFLLQNEKEKAREAYRAAIKSLPLGMVANRLQLKQSDLGGSNSKEDP